VSFRRAAATTGRRPRNVGCQILKGGMSRILAAWGLALAVLGSGASVLAQSPEYVLDTGDQVKIVVFGHTDLSGQFVVSSTGAIAMPLIGEVGAKGRTLRQVEAAIIKKLKPDFLKNPQVSAEVVNYRPFYIIGEVKNPGTYPFVNGMRILNAVAIAGGFTYRARENEMLITRAKGGGKPQKVSPNTRVLPGDVIEVIERYF
jgi:polysaccharide export outer membrane protein